MKTGGARPLCRAELVDLYAKTVPVQRRPPTNFQSGFLQSDISLKPAICNRPERPSYPPKPLYQFAMHQLLPEDGEASYRLCSAASKYEAQKELDKFYNSSTS